MMKRCLHSPEVRHSWGSVLVRYAVVFVSDFQQAWTLIHLHIALELIVSHFFQLLRRQIKRSNAVYYPIAWNLYQRVPANSVVTHEFLINLNVSLLNRFPTRVCWSAVKPLIMHLRYSVLLGSEIIILLYTICFFLFCHMLGLSLKIRRRSSL